MITSYLYALIGVLVVSVISLLGVFILSLKEELVKKYIFVLVSLAIGALLGDAFIHLIPEAYEELGSLTSALLIVGGLALFFILEKFMHWHHHEDDSNDHTIHPVGKLVLLSDSVHNFIDGIIIGMSFLADTSLGLATTLAVILHEIPQEMGDFAVLLHAGYSRMRAIWLNFLSALLAVAGTLFAFLLGNFSTGFTDWILPITAGGFIYIAVADLMPELHKSKKLGHSFLQLLSIAIGVIAMIALLGLE